MWFSSRITLCALLVCSSFYSNVASAVTENVIFADPVNVIVNGNSITKNSGPTICDGCDDAGGHSLQQITSGDGYVEFTMPTNTLYMEVGIGQGPGSTNVKYASVTQAIRFNGSGWAEVYDPNNTWLCGVQYAPGDRFRVSVTGGLVTYLNMTSGQSICNSSAVIPLYPVYPLVFAASIASAGASVIGATISYTPPVSNVLQMRLDEGSGAVSFQDSSGLGNNGSCSGTSCPQSGVTGKVNNAAQFNGSSNFIQVAGTNGLEPVAMVAVAAFIKASSANSTGSEVVSMGDSYALRLNPDGNAAFFYYAGNNSWIPVYSSGVNLLDNNFHHLVGQKTSSTIEIYIDGVLRGSLGATSMISYTLGTNLMIGCHGNGGARYFNGIIDEVGVYNRSLSLTEITTLASAFTRTASPADPSKMEELRLDEASGAVSFSDTSGNGNIGSCSGTGCPQAGIAGKIGLAAGFNGSSNFIQVAGNGGLTPLSTVAISAYFRTSSSGADGEEIASMGDDYAIRILANGNARFFYYAGNSIWYNVDSAGLNLLDNQIHHIVGQKTASTLEIYIDGQAAGSVPASGNIGYRPGGNLIIGRHGLSSARYFNGMIDEVYIYNRPLSGDEIFNLASSGSVIASLNLDEPAGAVWFSDASGLGNYGTCSGSSCPQAGLSGKVRAAVSLDGSSNFIQVAGNDSLRPASGVAASAFIKSAAVPSGADREEVISMGDDFSLSVLANGNVKFFYSNGTNSWVSAIATQVNVLDNQFHHLLGQKTSSAVEIYVDGTLAASSPASGSINYRAGGNLIIGKHGIDPTRYFSGVIDEVNIQNRSLTPGEVATLAGVAPPSSGSVPIGVVGIAPSTYLAYTGTDAIPVPPAPALGPAGYVFNDPTFGSRILRVTDANTASGHSFISEESGIARAFNANSTAIKLMDGYNGSFWVAFDPVNFRMAGGLNPVPFTGGFSNVWEWSAVNPDIIYFLNGNFIAQYNKATGVITNLAGPAGGTIPVSYHVAVVGKDKWVCSTAGLEGQNMYTRFFCVQPSDTSQSFLMNIPSAYSANDPNIPYGIHGIYGSANGEWLYIEYRGSGFGGNEVSVYNIASQSFSLMPNDKYLSGHTAIGDGIFVNTGGSINGSDDRGWFLRNPSNLADATSPFSTNVGTLSVTNGFFDGDHISWFNASTNRNAPFLSSRYHAAMPGCSSTSCPMPLAWWGEILGVAVDGSNTVYRFAHNHATSLLYPQYGLNCANNDCFFAEGFAQISNDGRFAIFSSDWDRSLGASGDFGIPTRMDVFIVELK